MTSSGLAAALAQPFDLARRRAFAESEDGGASRQRAVELEDALADPTLTGAARQRRVDERETLIARHASEWEPELFALARAHSFRGSPVLALEFELGLASRVSVRASDCEDLDVLARTGCYSLALRSVEAKQLARLLASSVAPRLRALELECLFDGDPEQVAALLAKLGPITELALTNVAVTPALAEAIAAHTELESLTLVAAPGSGSLAGTSAAALTRLTGLRSLTLAGQDLDAKGLAALLDAPFVPALERLGLTRIKLGAKGCKLIAAAELTNLRSLDLSGSTVGQHGAAIVASPRLARLAALVLDAAKISAKQLPAVLDALALPSLRTLHLSGLRCGSVGAEALAASGALARCGVTALSLAGNALGDDGAEVLAEAEGLAGVRQLALAGNGIRADGIAALAGSPLLTGLEALDLSNNKIQTKGAQTLAKSAAAASLRAIDIGHNWIGSKGAQALFRSDGLAALERVWLGLENNFGGAAVETLVGSELRLRELIAGTQAEPAAIRRLLESPASERLTVLQAYVDVGADTLAQLAAGQLGPALHTVYVHAPDAEPAVREAFDRRFACSAQRLPDALTIVE